MVRVAPDQRTSERCPTVFDRRTSRGQQDHQHGGRYRQAGQLGALQQGLRRRLLPPQGTYQGSKTQPDGMNRYGEKAAQPATGVETVTFERYEPEWNPGMEATRAVHWVVESERHVWQVSSRGANSNRSAALRPWTRVNNCTDKPEGNTRLLSITTIPPAKQGGGRLKDQSEPRL
jgi:hypothetical protein